MQPDDTTGDTNLSTVSMQPMTADATRVAKEFAASGRRRGYWRDCVALFVRRLRLARLAPLRERGRRCGQEPSAYARILQPALH
jgi:hypothetical protein